MAGDVMTSLGYTAHFTPEAWQGDYAVEVDPEGPREWDCTAYAGQHRAYLAGLFLEATGEPPDGVLDRDDVFKADPAAPQWVREWRGPFTIRVTKEPVTP
jgi:hypothetical protein